MEYSSSFETLEYLRNPFLEFEFESWGSVFNSHSYQKDPGPKIASGAQLLIFVGLMSVWPGMEIVIARADR